MKPKDLKAAFSWEERRPLLADRIFHVPHHYDQHEAYHFPDWEDPQLFGNGDPVCIEYCTGNGAWIVERAKQFPKFNWVAVEIRYDRVRKIWSKIKNENLHNLLVVCGDGQTFTKHYVKEHSIEAIYINFPDPWPKEKHKKHRIIKPPFLDEISRVLIPGKSLTFVSDDHEYVEHTKNTFGEHAKFKGHEHITECPDYGTSWFESLWRKKGRTINYLQFSTWT